ncbi:MAG: flagellar basal-body MS-ring/collar protein FliF [Gammaproteobacteria bacterium]
MALVNTENMVAQARGFNALPVLRQLGLMLGLAASVALGVAIVLWSRGSDYSMLYGDLSDSDTAQVAGALDSSGIKYRIERGSGVITVPGNKVHEARLLLATRGLPRGSGEGFELFDKEQGFGTSRFMEQARYNRAIEGELARSIATLQSVEGARVHLAIPKRSVFVRDRSKPRAAVVLNLFSGARLDDARLAGIVHLVAGSVPGLEAEQVTVVDQKGRLLTNSSSSREIALSSSQLTYTSKLEEQYMNRIMDIITPITGVDGVRAQVVADVDFTVVESTTQSYKPDNRAVRSEETFEEKSTGLAGAAGIPGALSNQPPLAGSTTDAADTEGSSARPVNSTTRATRNFELDHSVSHTRSAPGQVQRLSVAVLVDYRSQLSAEGKVERVPLANDELERITALVKEAVGFDAERNDTLNIANISFIEAAQIEPVAGPPVWQQPWIWSIAKQALGVVMVLLLFFGVLRPVLRSLVEKAGTRTASGEGAAGQLPLAADQLSLGGQPQAPAMPLEQQFGMARSMIENDPQRVAQVVKTWVAADG